MSDWNSNMDEAPYLTPVKVRLQSGREIMAQLWPDASMDSAEVSCDQWSATDEDDCPDCWSGGSCWESNEDEVASDQPVAFIPPPPETTP